jgi:hypothetical protein
VVVPLLDSEVPANRIFSGKVLLRSQLADDGDMRTVEALPDELAAALQAAVSGAEPMNEAIKQCFASGRTIDGVVVRRLYHLRTA